MENQIELVALTAIHRHTGPAIATDRCAEDGTPEVRQEREIVAPGARFHTDPTEAEVLIGMGGAARPGTVEARRAEERAGRRVE